MCGTRKFAPASIKKIHFLPRPFFSEHFVLAVEGGSNCDPTSVLTLIPIRPLAKHVEGEKVTEELEERKQDDRGGGEEKEENTICTSCRQDKRKTASAICESKRERPFFLTPFQRNEREFVSQAPDSSIPLLLVFGMLHHHRF